MDKVSLMDLSGQYKQIAEEVQHAILNILVSGKYILGPEVDKFEKSFANFCQAKYCIGTSSGFESLFLSLIALGIGSGDEVITVPSTFTATAEAIALTGAKPVFCDVEPETFVMNPNEFKAKITSRTKATIPVHLHGNPVDMNRIYKVSKEKNIHVIEDAAQAHGAIYHDKLIGSLQSVSTCFSFHPVKNLGAFGDAGAITTNNSSFAKKIRLLTNHGRQGHHKHKVIGTTGRLDTLQAGALSVKLIHLPRWIYQKRKLITYYKKLLPENVKTLKTTDMAVSAYHVFAILTEKRNKLAKYLATHGIETGVHYPIPLHLQKPGRALGYKEGDFPIAEKQAREVITLPSHQHITPEQIHYTLETIQNFYD